MNTLKYSVIYEVTDLQVALNPPNPHEEWEGEHNELGWEASIPRQSWVPRSFNCQGSSELQEVGGSPTTN